MIKASVVVCSYNSEKDIYTSLLALVNQQKVNPNEFEIILIDDGSIDNTEIIKNNFIHERKSLLPIFKYIKISHKGLSIARNTGLFNSSGELVLYIDVDAYADELWVYNLLKAWEINDLAFSIGGRIKIRNQEDKNALFLHHYFYDDSDIDNIIGANMSFKKQKLMDIGGFCDQFESRGDESMVFSKIKNNKVLIKANNAIVYHDRPTSIKKWLKERRYNGEMLNLINSTNHIFEFPYFRFVFRRLIFLSIIISIFYFTNFLILLFCLFAGIIYKILNHRKLLISKKLEKENYIFKMLLKWQLLSEAANWLELYGWLKYDKKNYLVSNVGTISNIYVIKNLTNLDF